MCELKDFNNMNNTFYKENNLSGLKRADFQKIVDGKETDLFILSNQQGAEVAITSTVTNLS